MACPDMTIKTLTGRLLYLSFALCVVDCRPNVLFIVVDDLRPSLGCYGYPNVVTPNIDQLASHSMMFTNAFSQQALCGPSRTAFLLSRRPETTKKFDNVESYWRKFPGNFTTLPQHFKENGYHTVSVGKIFHPGSLSGRTDDYPYSWSEVPYHPSTEQFRDAKVCKGPGSELYCNIVCPVKVSEQPQGTLPDIQSAQYAMQFLRNRSQNGDKEQAPFFLAVGFHKPHIPLKYPEEYRKLYPLSEIHLAKDHTLPKGMPSVAWNPWEDLRRRDDVKRLNTSFPYGPVPKHFQLLMRQSYYAATTYMDDLLGQVLSTLDELGLANNTIISFIGDHGWSLGEHQEWSKFSNFEVAVRVPLIVYIPGQKEPSGKLFPYINPFDASSAEMQNSAVFSRKSIVTMTQKQMFNSAIQKDSIHVKATNALVELVDLFPTLSELAGLPVPQICPQNSSLISFCSEGVSFCPIIKNAWLSTMPNQVNWKTAVFSQYPRPSVEPQENSDQPHLKDIKIMGYSMRTPQYRYTEWVKYLKKRFVQDWSVVYARELYDHDTDPLEDNNLADDPRFSALVTMLSSLLRAGWRNALPHNKTVMLL
ncbi:iduronate 2-sulfatase-like [Liolophura sinensis]|uniref:iduronate 2-sulfatase-like n=1 Tax=Liolophura sinensis TaxID=3198878 RepID=UPI0031586114